VYSQVEPVTRSRSPCEGSNQDDDDAGDAEATCGAGRGLTTFGEPGEDGRDPPEAAGAPEKNVGRVRIDRVPSTMAPRAALSPLNTLPEHE
jgi:hypothetical protein